MKSTIKKIVAAAIFVLIIAALAAPAFAAGSADEAESATAETVEDSGSSLGAKAIAAGICVGLAAAGGAVGMGMSISKSAEGISRQPEADGKIRTTLMLGLVFIETAIIYALIVAILVIFVL